jgi:response regulator RpfG family c-di-GMP phosphodiesterase
LDDKLHVLLALSADLANEHDLHSVLVKVTEATRKLLGADRCGIFLHDRKNMELWTIVADGVREIRIPENAGIAGYVLKNEKAVNIVDVYDDTRFDREVDKKTGYRTKSMLAIPLLNRRDDALGVFQVINKLDGESFSQDDSDLLNHIGMYAASAIESTQLYEQLRRAHQDVVYKLSHATKFKDPETQNHIIRVGLYCEVMGRSLGWDADQVETIKLASPMHDIGKVGVPDNILQKPGPLDDDEWVTMKKHTTFGYEILKDADSILIEVAAIVALEHHEKWCGKGYPAGKKGEDISIHGRMVALADVFDALTSKRSYKEPWPRDRVEALLREERGVHFDPKLADIFLDQIDDMYGIKEAYRD